LKTFRGRRDSLLCRILLGAWRPTSAMEIGRIKEIYNFRQPPVVGVPKTEVANTSVQWLCWMAGSYVGGLDTKTTSFRSACRKYLGFAIPRVCLWPCQPSWAPCMSDLPRSVCPCSPASLLWIPKTLRRNEGLSVGCAPNGPPKYFWVLGHYILETFLRPACLEWLCQTLCSHARYMAVSTLHMFKINIISSVQSLTTSSCDASFKILLGILGYWTSSISGLFEVGTPTRPP
jgi:hypothetical protein